MAGAGYGISDGAGGFVTKLEGDGDAKIGNSAEDVIQITGSLKVAGGAVFNEGSIAADFRVEGNNSDHMFFIDGTNDRIGIDTASPAALLHISSSTPGVLFRIDHPESGVDNPVFFVTGSSGNSRVGIGTETPDATFAISDNGKVLEVGSAAEGSWLEVNNGVVYLNLGGGTTIAGGTNLGQRFNISPINATYGALGIGKYPGSSVNILEVNSANSDLAGDFFVIKSDGKVGIGTTAPSVALEVDGDFKATEEVVFGTTSTDLGSGTTSTLTPASSIHLLTATSITSGGEGMHIMSLANGTATGQILKVIMNTTTNNQPIMVSPTNILGSYNAIAIENDKTGAAFEFIWNGSKWILVSNNALASVS